MKVLFEIGDIDWNQRTELSTSLSDEDESGAEKIFLIATRYFSIGISCKTSSVILLSKTFSTKSIVIPCKSLDFIISSNSSFTIANFC